MIVETDDGSSFVTDRITIQKDSGYVINGTLMPPKVKVVFLATKLYDSRQNIMAVNHQMYINITEVTEIRGAY